jgi:hypothetical protein
MSFRFCDRTVMLAARKEEFEEIDTAVSVYT